MISKRITILWVSKLNTKLNLCTITSKKTGDFSHSGAFEGNSRLKPSPLVYVIIINWNGKQYLSRCLSSLIKQTYPNFKILLIDNASTDNSVEFMQKKFPSVEIMQNSENLGFAAANNFGILKCLKKNAQFIFLLNNDTILTDKDLILKLVNTAFNYENVGIVGPKVLQMYNKQIVQDVGITCDIFGFPIGLHSGELNNHTHQGCTKVFGVSGSAMLLSRDVFQKVGYFDAEFFMFMEDIDLCWRANLAGYQVIVNADTYIFHEGGGTAQGGPVKDSLYRTSTWRSYLRERNTLRALLKNYSMGTLFWILPVYFLLETIELGFYFVLSKPKVFLAYLYAFFWNFRNLHGTFIMRNYIQKTRTAKDQSLMKMMFRTLGKLHLLMRSGIPSYSKVKA